MSSVSSEGAGIPRPRARPSRVVVLLGAGAVALAVVAGASGVEPTLSLPGTVTAEAVNSSGATVSFSVSANDPEDGPLTVSCSREPGSLFGLGTTTVGCSATDSEGNTVSGSFAVVVVDTTPPSLGPLPAPPPTEATSPAGAVVSYGLPSASDSVDGSPSVGCSPPSGATFPVGITSATCTATDNSGNIASGSFSVTVTDSVPPVLGTLPSPGPTEATSASGAVVGYALPSATDNADGSPTVGCSPVPGATFPLGTTAVKCTATDASGNSSSDSFSVIVRDTTKPSFGSLPSAPPSEATSAAGAVVSYALPSASDAVDGSPSVQCTPGSGATFPVGTTTVACTATDNAGNAGHDSFNVVVRDTTGPVVSVPGPATVEASGPAGAAVNYLPAPSAVDAVDGPVPVVTCSPASGSTLPPGPTTVVCSASDGRGNSGSASFVVRVVDTKAPVINGAPNDFGIYATQSDGIPSSNGTLVKLFAGVTAVDELGVDPNPTVTNDAPDFLPLGNTKVTFTATDHTGSPGNSSTKATIIRVLKRPPAGTSLDPTVGSLPDQKAPGDVTRPRSKVGNRSVTLRWVLPDDPDFAYVLVTRAVGERAPTAGEKVVYQGRGTSYTDTKLKNGVEYRYVIATFDRAGNRSAGVAVVVVGKRILLIRPAEDAVVVPPVKLAWARTANAKYYNVQLYRGKRKLLSAWPNRASLVLGKRWVYDKRAYQLRPGRYRWYVWPGFGKRADAKYGPALGSSTFLVKEKPA